MSREALPCIVCSKSVENQDDSFVNSPYEATAFNTHGHYGSTIFDPMNGTYLELNVCDACIERLAGEGKILMGQDRKPVVTDTDRGIPHLVGWLPVKRELVPWKPGLEIDDEDRVVVDRENVGNTSLFPEIEWHDAAVESIWAEGKDS